MSRSVALTRDDRLDFLNLKQTDAISPQTRKRGRRISPGERSAESKSDTIGIHIRSLSLIRIDTYRASGAENMIASSPLSRWVSIGGESEGGLMPPSGIHVAFLPSPLVAPSVQTRAVLCLILLRPRSPFTKISWRLSEIGLPEVTAQPA